MDTLDTGAGFKARLEPISSRFKWTFITKLIFVLIQVLFILYLVQMAKYSARIDQGDVGAAYEFQRSMGWMIVLGFLIFAIWALNVVMTCLWVYRAGLNLHLLELPGLRFTPGWCVGWFFIPVAWWFMPFLALSEIGKGSSAIYENDAVNWQNKPVPRVLIVWYVLFLMYWIYSVINYFMQDPEPKAADPILAFAKKVPELIVPSIIGLVIYIIVNTPSVLFAWRVTKQQHAYING